MAKSVGFRISHALANVQFRLTVEPDTGNLTSFR